MKNLVLVILLAVIFFCSCHKSEDVVTHINCDGLITDTLGKNDTARIYMQNAFTPNGDGVNELSRVIVKNVTSLTYTVYDGNNNIVFTTSQLGIPNATSGLAASGSWSTTATTTYETYYYKIQVTTSANNHIGICGELYKLSCYPAAIPKSSLRFESQLMNNGTYSNVMEALPNCP